MAGDNKDVELRIRARDYSQKTFEQLTQTLADLVKAQDKQLEAAKRGEVTARGLEKGYRDIENAAKALIAQSALVKTFQSQSDAVEDLQQKLAAARQKQEDYARSVAGTEKLSKEQKQALKDNAASVAANERALAKMEARLAATNGRMAEFGIDAAQAASTQQQIVTAVGQANAALERQHTAMDTLEADVAQHAAAARKANEEQIRSAQQLAEAKQRQKEADQAFAAAQLEAAARAKKAADEEAAALRQREQQLQVDRQFANEQAKAAEQQRKAKDAEAKAAKAAADAAKAQRDALDSAADQAERLSKEYAKVAAGGKSSFARGLAADLKDIADPATAAVRTLEGIDKALERVGAAVAAINGPIKNYKATLSEVEGVQKSLQTAAGQIDGYQKQMAAVKAAREEYVRARSALTDLTAQARSGNAGATLANDMTAAEAALKRAATAMADQTGKARTMRDALREAGVDTRNLGSAMEQMTAQATRARGQVEQLEAGYRKYGAEIEKADKANRMKWFDGGRTTLSWMQRIRGELIGLTTAYVGLQAGINLASGAIDAYRAKQTIETRLSQVVGDDAQKIAKEWNYLQGQADRLGFSFQPLALAYSKFSIAAKANGQTLQETRFIFEKFAEAARVAKMSTDEFEGALKAVEQMLSKGQIQAEELRGQLGDRLPGAMSIAAKAAGLTIEEFNKAMEKGEITSAYVIDIARQLGKEYGDGLGRATKSFEAENAKLQTAVFNFKLAIAEGGFIEAYTEFIRKLAELLNSQEGKQLAQSLSDGFTGVVQILQWCAENLDTLKLAFSAFLALNVFGWLSRVTANFGLLRTEVMAAIGVFGTMIATLRAGAGVMGGATAAAGGLAAGVTGVTGAVGLLTGALKLLARALPIIGAALTAYEVYNLLRGDKGEAKKAGKEIAKEFEQGLNEGGATDDPGRSGNDTRVYNALGKELERQQKALDKKAVTANMKGAKADLAERKRLIDEQYDTLRKQAENGISDEKKRTERMAQINKLSLQAQSIEEKKFNNEQATRGQGAADKRVRLAREVADEVARIEDDLAKRLAEADPNAEYEVRLKARMEAISHEYDKLMRKIDQMAKFDPQGAAKAKETVKAYVEQRQNVEKIKVQQEELQRLEGQANAQLQLRSALYEKLQAQYADGQMTQEQFQQAVLANNTTMATGIAAAAEKLRTFAESMKELLRPEQYQLIMARVETMLAQNNAATQNAQQSLTFGQEAHNKLLNEYKRQQEEINAKEAAGLLLKHEAINAQATLNSQYREQIIASATELQALATAATNPANKEAMQALIADAELLKTKFADARLTFTQFEQTVVNAAANSLNGAFDGMVDALNQMVTGQLSVADGFKEMARQSVLFFAQFLRDIALAILKQQLLNMLKNSGNPYLMAAGAIMGGTKHTGGVVGSPGGQKRVDPSVFAGAARFHDGGLPGLTAKEVPTILEKGEEVLTRDDPRNILNGGGGGGGSSKMVLVDDRESAVAHMTTPSGERAQMQMLKKNIPTIRQWLKG